MLKKALKRIRLSTEQFNPSAADRRAGAQLLRILIDNLPDCIFAKDLELRYTINNPANIRYIGAANEEETLGKTMSAYFDRETSEAIERYDRWVLEHEEPVFNYESIVVNSRGEKRILLTSKIPLKDEDSKVIGLLGISSDITEKRRAEEEIRSSEAKYKLMFDNNPLPMIMYTMPERNIIEVNAAAIEHYGYSRDEFLQMTLMDIRPPEDVPHFLEEAVKFPPGLLRAGPWRHQKKDGTVIYVEIFRNDIVYEGRSVRLLFVNDITERIRAEEQVRISFDELRQLASRLQDIREEERTAMAREVHDELGQQITGLKMDISWIVGKLPPATDEVITRKMASVLGLLDEAARTARGMAARLRPSILDDIGLAEALAWHSSEFEQRSGIKVDFHCEVEELNLLPKIVTGFFRIYQESLTNVARHSRATLVTSSIYQENGALVLRIVDNGIGFAMDGIGDRKTLGLLGMRERALMMGGVYEIKSTPGSGTTTLVSVPV